MSDINEPTEAEIDDAAEALWNELCPTVHRTKEDWAVYRQAAKVTLLAGRRVSPQPGFADGIEAAAPKPDPAISELVERLREPTGYDDARLRDLLDAAAAALTASNGRAQEVPGATAAAIEASDAFIKLRDELVRVERERDEARVERDEAYDGARQFRLRANAAEAEVSRLKAAFRDISSFSPDPASHIGPFEQIARHARATTLAALSNQAGASK